MNLRRWFRSLEPKAMALLHGPMGDKIRPWVDQHDILSFSRNPLAKGLAFGLLCGLLPLGVPRITRMDWSMSASASTTSRLLRAGCQ